MIILVGGGYFLIAETKLKFVKLKNDWRFIGHCFVNGSSEMVTEASAGITTFFLNSVLLKISGDVGVAGMSIVFNIHYLLISVHLGYIMGVAPLISLFLRCEGLRQGERIHKVLKGVHHRDEHRECDMLSGVRKIYRDDIRAAGKRAVRYSADGNEIPVDSTPALRLQSIKSAFQVGSQIAFQCPLGNLVSLTDFSSN